MDYSVFYRLCFTVFIADFAKWCLPIRILQLKSIENLEKPPKRLLESVVDI